MRNHLPFFKRAQRGQTIVILALAFVVLLGFVGIVTDISLMFVRYNTLRRAVDSAAVAAAGQVRRTLPTDQEIADANAMGGTNEEKKTRADGFALARNIATMNLAARQFIEFYGLSPSTVLVDTCASTPSDPDLKCLPDPVTLEQPPVRKLVRVTAQLDSPTVFLRLLGWPTVLLEATSISETAVLDVVLIFDSSESMANQTSYKDWETAGFNMHYFPPHMEQPINGNLTGHPELRTVYEQLGYNLSNSYNAWYDVLNLSQSQINSDPNHFPVIGYTVDGNHNVVNYQLNPTDDSLARQPRQDCRVRFFPSGGSSEIPYGNGAILTPSRPRIYADEDNVWKEYTSLMQTMGVFASGVNFSKNYDAFVPAYNYYGCCNDPTGAGDYLFDDLICQPFRQMRDSTEQFLKQIDFARGDRVALVTFDRYAYLIDPDGGGEMTPMMTTEGDAVTALRNSVGVRAENSFYADTNNDGKWDAFVINGTPYSPDTSPGDPAHSGTPIRYDSTMTDIPSGAWSSGAGYGFNGTQLGGMQEYPVKDSCRFKNAILAWPKSKYSSPPPENADPLVLNPPQHPYVASRYPTPLAAFGKSWATFTQGAPVTDPVTGLQSPGAPYYPAPSAMGALPSTLGLPNLNDLGWDSLMTRYSPQTRTDKYGYARQIAKAQFTYEFAAGCGGSNVGAGLRVGNNALVDKKTVRTNGAVWVMVLLGDGAAAGSDPVRRNGNELYPGDPYGNPFTAVGPSGQYGVYGLCPYGTTAAPNGTTDNNGSGALFSAGQPRCTDPYPETRHPFCFNTQAVIANNIYIDLANNPSCDTQYDVDDYARDWADYIALSVPDFEGDPQSQVLRSAQQLPTIFTIGFGLDFQDPVPPGPCLQNVSDCLGEELLRYIADDGDNQRIDSDWQQDVKRGGGVPNETLTKDDLNPGDRGPCEGPIIGYGNTHDAIVAGNPYAIYNPLPPTTSCGNYYNAPDAARLQQVFDDIASRMFTRLTR